MEAFPKFGLVLLPATLIIRLSTSPATGRCCVTASGVRECMGRQGGVSSGFPSPSPRYASASGLSSHASASGLSPCPRPPPSLFRPASPLPCPRPATPHPRGVGRGRAAPLLLFSTTPSLPGCLLQPRFCFFLQPRFCRPLSLSRPLCPRLSSLTPAPELPPRPPSLPLLPSISAFADDVAPPSFSFALLSGCPLPSALPPAFTVPLSSGLRSPGAFLVWLFPLTAPPLPSRAPG